MSNFKLFQYAIIWHPTQKQVKEEGLKSKVIQEITNLLAVDQGSAYISAAMSIPQEYKDQIDQIEIAIRPF